MLPQLRAKLTRGSGFRRENGYSAVGMISLDRNWGLGLGFGARVIRRQDYHFGHELMFRVGDRRHRDGQLR